MVPAGPLQQDETFREAQVAHGALNCDTVRPAAILPKLEHSLYVRGARQGTKVASATFCQLGA